MAEINKINVGGTEYDLKSKLYEHNVYFILKFGPDGGDTKEFIYKFYSNNQTSLTDETLIEKINTYFNKCKEFGFGMYSITLFDSGTDMSVYKLYMPYYGSGTIAILIDDNGDGTLEDYILTNGLHTNENTQGCVYNVKDIVLEM